ncbi:protein LDOC1-like [Ambystoma mexicanum]|uniref:protein LDOC1-like n=1 Tax=Ambystoma mexicanum TaxID=8296 RepID=UPI0037E74CAD
MDEAQELWEEMRVLRAEMTALCQENIGLRQMVAQGSGAAPQGEGAMSHTAPIKFDRDSRRVAEFCNHCKIHFLFRASYFNSDKAKIGYLLGNLTGNALAWAAPLVSANSPILNDFAAFEKTFLEVFQSPNLTSAAQNQLMDLKQGSMDIIAYIARFH